MKHRIALPCLLAVALALPGCKSMDKIFTKKPEQVMLNAVNSFYISDKLEQEKNYQQGVIQTVYVGQPVIKRKTFNVKVKSELVAVPPMDAVLSNRELALNLRAGRAYPVKYETNQQGRIYQVLEVYKPDTDHYYGMLASPDGALGSMVLDGNLALPGAFDISPINARVDMRRVETVISRENTENFEIVFGGMSNNQINLTYREFTPGDVAKTAFYQDLTYPLNSQFIRYQNLKIQVHEISPEYITFVVVQE